MTARVVFLQRILPAYRVPFVTAAQVACAQADIRLTVAFGREQAGESPTSVPDDVMPDCPRIANHYLPRSRLVWQSIPTDLLDADLIIVEQANRLLVNYALMLRRSLWGRPARLAYWAHGANWQGDPHSWREAWKRRMRAQADFWFCYTQPVADLLAEVPTERKCSVDNAIDTTALMAAIQTDVTAKDPHHLVFIGSMRADKRFPWIFRALDAARARVPTVTAAFIGDGPEAPAVRAFCATRPWAIWHGALHGTATAPHLRRAGGLLMPGLVGLVVLDSFVAEAPLLTTPFDGRHSPEFAYATPGENALVSADTPEAYAELVVQHVLDPTNQERLRVGCRAAAGRYTIANMATRFTAGVQQALALLPRRTPA